MRTHVLYLALMGLLVVLTLLMAGCGGSMSPGDEGMLAVPADNDGLTPVLIGFRGAPGASDEALVRGKDGKIGYTYRLIPAVSARLPQAAIEVLKSNPRIAYIEPDARVKATADSVPWGVTRVKADQAWPKGNVGAGVKVAVLDTGIDYNHPDLAPNYAGGYDFVNADADPLDDHGHGTHVAGTVAAAADGATVQGAAPGASLYALKVLAYNGGGSYSAIIAALQWCVDNHVAVASMSLSGTMSSTALQSACDAAYNAGVLLVAAAGNSGNAAGTGATVEYPAAYESVIAVGSTDSLDKRSSTSSTGPELELVAPGSSIVSDKLGGGTIIQSGTSMACPHVSGAAALLVASGMTGPATLRARLTGTATDLGASGRDSLYGCGLVNAASALGITTTSPGPKPKPNRK